VGFLGIIAVKQAKFADFGGKVPKRPDPDIAEEQIEELRRRKHENSGGYLKYLDIVEVFGPGFPISLVLARKLLPPDLHMELLQCVANQELFFDRIEDLLADFLDTVAASLPKNGGGPKTV